MQTSLLLLYKNMVRGEFPELEVERKVALYKLQARLRLRLSMAIGGRGVLRAASEGGAGDAAPPPCPRIRPLEVGPSRRTAAEGAARPSRAEDHLP